MSFEIGHAKLGGRKKGTPNKASLSRADDLLIELHINPIMKLVEIAESGNATLEQRINCYKEIAKYTYPRLKLQDLRLNSIDDNTPMVIKLVAGKPL
jgi:hypothetical protein